MTFDISKFIKTNRVYFIWGIFMGLLYLFKDMFGLVFITFIMCFITTGITHYLRQKYRWNRRAIVVCTYILFIFGVIAFLTYVPPHLLSETISFTEQLPTTISSVKNKINSGLASNEMIAPL